MTPSVKEIKELFGMTDQSDIRVYSVHMEGNPFTDLSNHATSDIHVTQVGENYYAVTGGTLDETVATEIIDIKSDPVTDDSPPAE